MIGSKEEIMHNKFCIIDHKTVITGSYNWTRKAKTNDENITVTKDSPELATDFVTEFQRNNRIIFEINHNDYRLIAEINYQKGWMFIKFIGTHAEYDKADAAIIDLFKAKKRNK